MKEEDKKIEAPSLPEYFRDLVREAMGHQRLEAPQGVEFYLVNLLKESAKTDDLYGVPPEGFREEPLAFLFSRAAQADGRERIQILKRLGDFSLYIAGFFPASFTRQLVDVGYYVQMGESAYGSLSQLLARHAAFSEIFTDLARRFVAYVDILSEVSEKTAAKNATDLLRIYETWLKTGSERAKKLLSEKGIFPYQETTLKIQ